MFHIALFLYIKISIYSHEKEFKKLDIYNYKHEPMQTTNFICKFIPHTCVFHTSLDGSHNSHYRYVQTLSEAEVLLLPSANKNILIH